MVESLDNSVRLTAIACIYKSSVVPNLPLNKNTLKPDISQIKLINTVTFAI